MDKTNRRQFLRQACGVAFAATLAPAGVAAGASQPRVSSSTHVVVIEGMRFDPAELTVRRGDRIVWTNKDLFPHSVTAGDKAFDSNSIAPNASWTYVSRTPGTYTYGCSYHPTMKAMLRVL